MYSGKDSSDKRDEILQQFMENESPRILLASLKAGGVGINLQRANRVFILIIGGIQQLPNKLKEGAHTKRAKENCLCL